MERTPNIVVIDYESGNLRSVAKALESLGVTPLVTGDPDLLATADGAILPGVGSAPQAMSALESRNLVEPIKAFLATGRPFLGVCLGLQLLLDRTEEGDAPCLGIVPGTVKRFHPGEESNLKVPHMGWNSVDIRTPHPLLEGIGPSSQFYFVHSYYAAPDEAENVAGSTDYGVTFCSILARDNLLATQFHPEKSGPVGLRIYENFVALAGSPSRSGNSTLAAGRTTGADN